MINSFGDIVNGKGPVLVDFHATWCGPCQTMSPIVDEVKNHFGSQLRVLKIDVDKNQVAAAKYKVRGVPTFLLFKEGEVVWRSSGLKTRRDLEGIINQHI